MTKFGEIIDSQKIVLIVFYDAIQNSQEGLDTLLKSTAKTWAQKIKVVKIEANENRKLSEALKIEEVPAWMLYKGGEMVWRKDGVQTLVELDKAIEQFS